MMQFFQRVLDVKEIPHKRKTSVLVPLFKGKEIREIVVHTVEQSCWSML